MANNFSITLEGSDKLLAQLKKLGTEAVQAAAGSLYRSAERTMTKSKEIYVPVLTGALRSTGHVSEPEITRNSVTVELGYGGPAVDYAIVVHENPNAQHKPPTQWKYLETPMKEDETSYVDALIEDLNTAFEKL